MKRYPKYKDSGIDWIGEIPEHWEVKRLKLMARIKNGQDYKLVHTDQHIYPVIGSGGQFTYASQYLFKGESVLLGRKGTVDKPLYINSAFWTVDTMFYTEINNNTFPKFLYYSALTIPFKYLLTNTTVPSMTQYDLGNHFFAFAPISEQKYIARFLNRKLEQINHFISNKQRLIELLKEQKTGIINRAITKGLNPHTPMKPSGIEWLGEIPAHWELIRLGRLCNVTKLTGFEYTKLWKTDPNGEVIALRGLNIKNNRLLLDDVEKISVELSNQLKRSKLFARDIVFPCTGTLGHGALIEQDNKYHINQNIAKITPIEDINPNFLLYMLCCSSMQYQINRLNFSGLQPVLLIGTIRNLILQIPPRVEQNQIVNWLNTTTAKIDLAIAKIEKEIELIQEYRTTLISDAVTGKIDVRDTSVVETTLTTAGI